MTATRCGRCAQRFDQCVCNTVAAGECVHGRGIGSYCPCCAPIPDSPPAQSELALIMGEAAASRLTELEVTENIARVRRNLLESLAVFAEGGA